MRQILPFARNQFALTRTRVRIPLSAKDNRNLRIAVVFFCYELIFTTVCDIINLISELIYFQHLFFIGRDYKIGRENLDRLLDIREPMKILILM